MKYFKALPYEYQTIFANNIIIYKRFPEYVVNQMISKGYINLYDSVLKKKLIEAGYHIMLLCDVIKKRKREKRKCKKKLQKDTLQKTKDNLENILEQIDIDINNLRYTPELTNYIEKLTSDGITLIFGNVLNNGNILELSDGSRPDSIIKIIINKNSGSVKVELINMSGGGDAKANGDIITIYIQAKKIIDNKQGDDKKPTIVVKKSKEKTVFKDLFVDLFIKSSNLKVKFDRYIDVLKTIESANNKYANIDNVIGNLKVKHNKSNDKKNKERIDKINELLNYIKFNPFVNVGDNMTKIMNDVTKIMTDADNEKKKLKSGISLVQTQKYTQIKKIYDDIKKMMDSNPNIIKRCKDAKKSYENIKASSEEGKKIINILNDIKKFEERINKKIEELQKLEVQYKLLYQNIFDDKYKDENISDTLNNTINTINTKTNINDIKTIINEYKNTTQKPVSLSAKETKIVLSDNNTTSLNTRIDTKFAEYEKIYNDTNNHISNIKKVIDNMENIHRYLEIMGYMNYIENITNEEILKNQNLLTGIKYKLDTYNINDQPSFFIDVKKYNDNIMQKIKNTFPHISDSIIKTIPPTENNFDIKMKWVDSSCWVDAVVISLFGIGLTSVSKAIEKKCGIGTVTHKVFCSFLEQVFGVVNNKNMDIFEVPIQLRKEVFNLNENHTSKGDSREALNRILNFIDYKEDAKITDKRQTELPELEDTQNMTFEESESGNNLNRVVKINTHKNEILVEMRDIDPVNKYINGADNVMPEDVKKIKKNIMDKIRSKYNIDSKIQIDVSEINLSYHPSLSEVIVEYKLNEVKIPYKIPSDYSDYIDTVNPSILYNLTNEHKKNKKYNLIGTKWILEKNYINFIMDNVSDYNIEHANILFVEYGENQNKTDLTCTEIDKFECKSYIIADSEHYGSIIIENGKYYFIDIMDKKYKEVNTIPTNYKIEWAIYTRTQDGVPIPKKPSELLSGNITELMELKTHLDTNVNSYGNDAMDKTMGNYKFYDENKHKLFDFNSFMKISSDILNSYQTQTTGIGENKVYIQKKTISNSKQVIIIGDIHSSLFSVIHILNDMKNKNIINDDYKLSENYMMVFLGDIVDRGPYSLELLYIIFKLKKLNPEDVIICNGNHEDPVMYNKYGLGTEMSKEIRSTEVTLRNNIEHILSLLPSALFMRYTNGKWYQFCHGGIEPGYDPFVDLNNEQEFIKISKQNVEYANNGFKWTDFDNSVPDIEQGSRGWVYGVEATKKYLSANDIKCIISGHQDLTNFGILAGDNNNDVCTYYSGYDYGLTCPDLKNMHSLEITDNKPLALITSTSIEARHDSEQMNYTIYLILHENNLNIVSLNKNTGEPIHNSKPGTQLPSTQNKYTFKLMSWNIYYNIMNYSNEFNQIKNYIKKESPNILMTQESYFKDTTLLGNNYETIWWQSKKAGIGICYDNKVFSLDSQIIRYSIEPENAYNNISDTKTLEDENNATERPILAVRLRHNVTQKKIILINVWAPHNIKKDKMLEHLNGVLTKLQHTMGDRVIIGGDFNELYLNNRSNINKITVNKIPMWLKQTNETCCGDPDHNESTITPSKVFDLLFDSNENGMVTHVENDYKSDHLPVIAIVDIPFDATIEKKLFLRKEKNGIQNLENICYMSSGMHLLMDMWELISIKPVANYTLEGKNTKDNTKSYSINMKNIFDVLKEIHASNETYNHKGDIGSTICIDNNPSIQNDTSEWLSMVLNYINDNNDINYLSKLYKIKMTQVRTCNDGKKMNITKNTYENMLRIDIIGGDTSIQEEVKNVWNKTITEPDIVLCVDEKDKKKLFKSFSKCMYKKVNSKLNDDDLEEIYNKMNKIMAMNANDRKTHYIQNPDDKQIYTRYTAINRDDNAKETCLKEISGSRELETKTTYTLDDSNKYLIIHIKRKTINPKGSEVINQSKVTIDEEIKINNSTYVISGVVTFLKSGNHYVYHQYINGKILRYDDSLVQDITNHVDNKTRMEKGCTHVLYHKAGSLKAYIGDIFKMKKINDYALVDPAGKAFKNNNTSYNGSGGLSGKVYDKIYIDGRQMKDLKHNIKLKSYEALLNNNQTKFNKNDIKIIHAIGPDYSGKNVDQQYWDYLKTTLINIKLVMIKNNISKVIIPLISSNIYKPNNLDLDEYIRMFIEYIREIFSTDEVIVPFSMDTEKERFRSFNKADKKIDEYTTPPMEGGYLKYNINKKKYMKLVKLTS
jgi:gluconate kinase